MPLLTNNTCISLKDINNMGGKIIENNDGSVSVFIKNTANVLTPLKLTKQCCLSLNPNYTFDADTQTCLWSNIDSCDIENSFNIILNPNNNDGVFFDFSNESNCAIDIDFNFLIKIKCETLFNFLSQNTTTPTVELSNLQEQINEQIVLCETIANNISLLNEQITNTPYSINCTPTISDTIKIPSMGGTILGKTGFGLKDIQTNLGQINNQTFGGNFCLTEPDGLLAWSQILGDIKFQQFLNGDLNSYDCNDFNQMYSQYILLTENSEQYMYSCDIPFGTRTDLESQLQTLLQEQIQCNLQLNLLNSQLQQLQQTNTTCNNIVDFFENIELALTLSVLTGGTEYTTIYEDTTLFPEIGNNNLYDYLVTNQQSGFYVCGGNDCTPLNLGINTNAQTNKNSCDIAANNIVNELYQQFLIKNNEDISFFKNTLNDDSFNSEWLNFKTLIDDTNILNIIDGHKIKIGIKVSKSCGDFCLLIDEIKLNKRCTTIKQNETLINSCPGFNLTKIKDNKKSWNTEIDQRKFDITNVYGNSILRETKYNVSDDRLVINSKEIDLNIDIASAIETDVWCFLQNNHCLLTGNTECDPCGDNKQFQDNVLFDFMDGIPYEFMDTSNFNNGNQTSICCGDNKLDFTKLITTPLSSITSTDEFKDQILSELIDVKNRQTISTYPTLRALYDRYINSYAYCSGGSLSFNYIIIDNFATLIQNYWIDIIEQVIPSTTIWGGTKIYTNTSFDQQKYKYRAYSTLLCKNSFTGDTVLSPINGIYGQGQNVNVNFLNLMQTKDDIRVSKNQINACDDIFIAQMNHGSEFIGSVNIIGENNCNQTDSSISECTLKLNIITNGLNVNVTTVGGTSPISYSWSNGLIGSNVTFSESGTYILTVADANCCRQIMEVTV